MNCTAVGVRSWTTHVLPAQQLLLCAAPLHVTTPSGDEESSEGMLVPMAKANSPADQSTHTLSSLVICCCRSCGVYPATTKP
jgi:hypothetical protein